MAVLKRLDAPGFWQIEKKTNKYTVATLPGPHSRKTSITLAVVIREMLNYAENLKEVREILNTRTVKVDGVSRTEPGFPVGLMDIVSIGDENYRILPGKHGLYLKRIGKNDAPMKLQKIIAKTMISKGKIQLQFHDGTIMVADNSYKTGDVIVIDSVAGKIKDVIRQEKGAKVIVIKGNNKGVSGTLEHVKIVKSSEPNIATISSGERKITLPLNYIFAVGKNEPIIPLGEDDE